MDGPIELSALHRFQLGCCLERWHVLNSPLKYFYLTSNVLQPLAELNPLRRRYPPVTGKRYPH